MNARSAPLWLLLTLCTGCGGEPTPTPLALGKQTAALSGTLLWEQKTPGVLPPARMAHALVYDPVRQLTTAAGGRSVSDSGNSLADTWSWDGQTWTPQTAGLPNRGYMMGAFDLNRQVTVLYGGVDEPAGFPRRYFAQTLERSTGSWSQTAGTPSARATAALAYDASRGVTVLFGGWSGSAWLSDIWEWNGSTWTQRCTTAPCSTAARPARRESAVFVYDAARAVTVLFGGWGDNQPLGDTWTWDGSTWTVRNPAAPPAARTRSAGAYDPATQRVYVFGGVSGATANVELNDLWTWDGSAWERLAATTPPSVRRDLGLAWDTARRRAVLFGGRSNNQAVDFWEFSLVGNSCSSDTECHNGVCLGTVCGDEIPEPDAGPAEPDAAGAAGAAGASGAGGAAGSAGETNGGAGSGSTPEVAEDSGVPANEVPSLEDPVPHPGGLSKPRSLYSCSSAPLEAQSSSGALSGLAASLLAALFAVLRRRAS